MIFTYITEFLKLFSVSFFPTSIQWFKIIYDKKACNFSSNNQSNIIINQIIKIKNGIIRNYNSNLYFFLGFFHNSKIFFSLPSMTSTVT